MLRSLGIVLTLMTVQLLPAPASASSAGAAGELRGVVTVAGGRWHTCAVKSDGTAWCWGRNDEGQLGDGSADRRLNPVRVAGLTDVVGIASGEHHSCAVVADGGVWCWGGNASGQLGIGSLDPSLVPVRVAGLGAASAVSNGKDHTCALLRDGTVYCWGRNAFGEVGDGSTVRRTAPAQVVGLGGAIAVSAEDAWHSCALVAGGTAYCWGRNDSGGQLGDGTRINRSTPVAVTGLSAVANISAGSHHTCAVTQDGRGWCWGQNRTASARPSGFGQLGDGTLTDSNTPVRVLGPADLRSITAGSGASTCALTTGGGVRCWGHNGFGQVGDASMTHQPAPASVVGIAGVTAVSNGGDHACAIVALGAVRCWGANFHGAIGDGTLVHRSTPVAVKSGDPRHRATPVTVLGLGGVRALAAGGEHTCGIVAGGLVRCWGSNNRGQLGDGTHVGRAVPAIVRGVLGATALAAGGDHTCAVVAGGAVRCWGHNELGQLGDGTLTDRATPVRVTGITGATALAAGRQHTCAIVAGGGVRCWGHNFVRQLGNVPSGQFGETAHSTPVAVVDVSDTQITGAVRIAANGDHTCISGTADAVRCWGFNHRGQLGPVSPTQPQTIAGLAGATLLASGGAHNCGVLDGAVRCLGENNYGQLGDGTTTDTSTPVPVGALAGVTALTAADHTCAVTADRTVSCWGFNDHGQLGDGTTANRAVPVQVGELRNAVAVIAGASHTCALVASGQVRCWGLDDRHQLGLHL